MIKDAGLQNSLRVQAIIGGFLKSRMHCQNQNHEALYKLWLVAKSGVSRLCICECTRFVGVLKKTQNDSSK